MVAALRQGAWMDKERFKRYVFVRREKMKVSINLSTVLGMSGRPHAETGCRQVYSGKVLIGKNNLWRQRRRLGMAVVGYEHVNFSGATVDLL